MPIIPTLSTMEKKLFAIVIASILVRLGYQCLMLGFEGSFHNGSDSGKYLSIAEGISVTGQLAWVDSGTDDQDGPW